MKKTFFLLSALLIAALTITGCSSKNSEEIKIDNNSSSVSSQEDSTLTKTDEPLTNIEVNFTTDSSFDGSVGKIQSFQGEFVHIVFADIINIFKVAPENSKNFYLGQSVKLKQDGDSFILEDFIREDFKTKHTSMGTMIESISGVVAEDSDGQSLVVSNKDQVFTFKYNRDQLLSKGTNVSVDYTKFNPSSDDMQVINVYNDDAKLTLVVDSIERTDNGIMLINAKEDIKSENIDFIVTITSSTVVEFNRSELKANDIIEVYSDIIMESYPAQVTANKVVMTSLK